MAQGISMQALERAVRMINGIISRSTPAEPKQQPTKAKWVSITARGRGKAPVRQSSAAARTLAAYLALPVEQYSLLDPTWIERQPGSEATFCLKAPLQSLTGVNLEPRVWVTVEPGDRAVTFSSERASLGDPALDKRFSLSLASTLSFQEDAATSAGFTEQPASLPANPCQEEQQHRDTGHDRMAEAAAASMPAGAADAPCLEEQRQRDTGHDRMAEAPAHVARMRAQSAASMRALQPDPEPDLAALTGAPARLHAAVRVSMRVRLAPPLAAVPGLLLRYAGGLVATALLQALVPILLDLLARDYERWATGAARSSHVEPAGSQAQQAPAMMSLEL